MTHYLIELALLILLAYFIGALIGCWLRKLTRSTAAPSLDSAWTEPPPAKPQAIPLHEQAALEAHHTPKAAEPLPEVKLEPDPVVKPATVTAPAAAAIAATAAATAAVRPATPSVVTKPVVSAAVKPAASHQPAPAAPRTAKPKGLSGARGGKADNLQRLSGVGPKNEKVLHSLGFFHFDQIADWTAEQIDWVDDHLKFGGRIKREEWVRQARLLAEGKEAEFTRLYGSGGLKTKSGTTLSGSRTRR